MMGGTPEGNWEMACKHGKNGDREHGKYLCSKQLFSEILTNIRKYFV